MSAADPDLVSAGSSREGTSRARLLLEVRGTVQGVGFRPFIHGLAEELQLAGSVQNRGGHVVVDIEGERDRLFEMKRLIRERAPSGAEITSVSASWLPFTGYTGFAIEISSVDLASSAFIAPDRATCIECERDFDDVHHRLHGYALLACTDCGPRLSTTERAPFDRSSTTLEPFSMCSDCGREHGDRHDRRFHSVMLACERCGPRIRFFERAFPKEAIEGPVSIDRAALALSKGSIGLVKGVGGYHLACDARDSEALRRLRSTKRRADKPFAVLFADVEALVRVCRLGDVERRLVESPERPIVLLEILDQSLVAAEVAPRAPVLGAMLPPTAMHRALARAAGFPLVLTSCNENDEPMAITIEAATLAGGDSFDFTLDHPRAIAQRIDDSVARVVSDRPVLLRRARGYVPRPIRMANSDTEVVLGVGAELMSTFTFAVADRAIMSQHLGDLESVACSRELDRAIDRYERLLGVVPSVIAHDLHPDFVSTRWAHARAASTGALSVGVQHHHAHFAAVLLEASIDGPAIGVVFDGLGLGTDGALWGGEILLGDMANVRRYGHLRYVPMPGGERAAKEGFRMAIAHLSDAGLTVDTASWGLTPREADLAQRLFGRASSGPPTSSVGRLFDAVSTICGIAPRSSYEGRAAIELEWAAMRAGSEPPYPLVLEETLGDPLRIDTRPLVTAIVEDRRAGISPERIAKRFHETLAHWIASLCERAREESSLSTVVLAGGVFANGLLLASARARLEERRFTVVVPTRMPPNDGAISLGQVAVARARMQRMQREEAS